MSRDALSTEREQKLRRNPRLLFWSSAFRELQAINAFITVFHLRRGVEVDEVFFLSIFFSVVTLALEVFSGIIADRIGRKRSMILGGMFFLLSISLVFFAHGFWWFVLVIMLQSAGYAFVSGAEGALLYDTLEELGETDKVTHHNGRLQSARHVLKIFIPTIAAFVASDLAEWQFSIVIGADVIIKIISLVIVMKLVEPVRITKLGKGIWKEMKQTLRSNTHLLRLTMNRWGVFAAGFVLWRTYQPFFEEVGFGAIGLGIFYLFMHAFGMFSKWHIGRFEQRLGSQVVLSVLPFFGFVCVALLPTLTNQTATFFVTLLAFTLIFMRQPLFMRMMHEYIEPSSRATTESALNMFKPFVDIPLLFAAGYVADVYGWAHVFYLAAAFGIATLVICRIKPSDYAFNNKPS